MLASGVASAQEPPPTPGSSSGWFDPAESKKPSDSKPTPETPPVTDAAPPSTPDDGVAAPKAPETSTPTKPPAGSRTQARKAPPEAFDGPPPVWPPAPTKPHTSLVFGGGMGWVSGRFSHPDLIGTGFNGLATNLHAGLSLSPSVVFGLDILAYRTSVEYVGAGKYGYENANNRVIAPRTAPQGGVRLTAAGDNGGGDTSGASPFHAGPVNVLTIGPRLQFAPDPVRGLYGVVTGGFTFLEGSLNNITGTAVGARAGYRFGITKSVGFGLELGGSAHRLGDSTALFGFGGAQLQLRL
jgi:hypothetical protein